MVIYQRDEIPIDVKHITYLYRHYIIDSYVGWLVEYICVCVCKINNSIKCIVFLKFCSE